MRTIYAERIEESLQGLEKKGKKRRGDSMNALNVERLYETLARIIGEKEQCRIVVTVEAARAAHSA